MEWSIRGSGNPSLVKAATVRSLIHFLLLLSFLNISLQTCQRPTVFPEDIIPEGYDNFQTPDNDGKPTEVKMKIVLLNIRSVDVSEMSFIADMFLYQRWRDPRLQYPAPASLERIALHPEWRHQIWTPDIYFYNAIEAKVLSSLRPYVSLWMHNDSTLLLGARLSMEFSCDMLLHKFPHDTQTCDIIVKSLIHGLSEMELHWDEDEPITLGDRIILPQFELAQPRKSICVESDLVNLGANFACLRGIIRLTRRSGYYVINIYIPTVLIVFMSMLTFWIPVDAVPGRVTLGVTSLLTIITKQYQASLPSVSYVVALNVWLSVCIGFVFCGLLEYSAVVALRSHQLREVRSKPVCGGSILRKLEMVDVLAIDRLCRVIFPLVFIVHCAIYCAIYM